MKTYPYIAYELMSCIDILAASAEIVPTHQQRYDATGYPQGLGGPVCRATGE